MSAPLVWYRTAKLGDTPSSEVALPVEEHRIVELTDKGLRYHTEPIEDEV